MKRIVLLRFTLLVGNAGKYKSTKQKLILIIEIYE